MTNLFITLESVSFVLPDGSPLFSQLNESFDSRHTGIVGRNGVGKSVLSQILAGKILPSSGRCNCFGVAYYLAQQTHYQAEMTVAELARVQSIISALERIEMGSISTVDFELVGQQWDIRQRLQIELE
ncbi:ATP-binding cassette domain-containing protein, partial [Buttiauxella noackiae]|uniref:ATP-binding cassette domain-containing protein n=1 Tax=Buttiauxella noackiae TaxID=82992 RepID=UPI002356907D